MPDWQDRLEKARRAAREAAGAAREGLEAARARSAPARARAMAKAAEGRTLAERKMAERRAARAARARWFETASGDVHTEAFADEGAMRQGLEAAAAHGWQVETIAPLPVRSAPRLPLGGITGLLAREAVQRVRQPDRYLVTFRRTAAAGG